MLALLFRLVREDITTCMCPQPRFIDLGTVTFYVLFVLNS